MPQPLLGLTALFAILNSVRIIPRRTRRGLRPQPKNEKTRFNHRDLGVISDRSRHLVLPFRYLRFLLFKIAFSPVPRFAMPDQPIRSPESVGSWQQKKEQEKCGIEQKETKLTQEYGSCRPESRFVIIRRLWPVKTRITKHRKSRIRQCWLRPQPSI